MRPPDPSGPPIVFSMEDATATARMWRTLMIIGIVAALVQLAVFVARSTEPRALLAFTNAMVALLCRHQRAFWNRRIWRALVKASVFGAIKRDVQ